jgi:hypothetical protein
MKFSFEANFLEQSKIQLPKEELSKVIAVG